jgi:selenium-dependent xanthine dehydrogenase
MSLTLRVNGEAVSLEEPSGATLAEVLRDRLGLTGVKVGCGEGECGACTVLLDGRPVASCLTPAAKAEGRQVVTVEGLAGPGGELGPVQRAFLAEGAVQCGFCTPGMLMAATALLARNPDPSGAEIARAFTGHLCRCTGYHTIVRAVRRAAESLRTGQEIALEWGEADPVGRPVVRKDGVAKVTGAQRFGADTITEGELHAVALFSAHPYAQVLALDTSRARAIDGVVAVLTAADVPGQNSHGIIIPHQPVLVPVGERVRSIGDVLALVIAETEAIARAAVDGIDVEYRLLQGVFSPRDALAPGAPILHPPRPGDEPSNVMYGTHVERGDVDTALAAADVLVEGCFRTPFIEHAYLEPEAGTAEVDAAGVVIVRMASQAVGFHHRGVAAVLGLPLDRVRLIHVSPGGGFGARNDMSLHPYLGLAAYHSGRPVKMVLTRAESLRFHTKRHAMEHTLRLGASRDGRIVALACDILADTGAYSSAGIPVLDQATLFATGPYDIPNVRVRGRSVYTNNVACGAMRGFGIPQSAFAVESLVDELAQKLGMSPFDLRRRNALRPGSTTSTGQVLGTSTPYLETLDAVERALAAAEEAMPPPSRGYKRGVGVASCYKNVGLGLGLPEPTGVAIDLTPAGRILIRFGGAELGQGAETVVAQMAAQALGVPYSLIDILGCDTGRTPDGGITSASRTTYMSGNAVVEAAPRFLERVRAFRPGSSPLTPELLAGLGRALEARGEVLSVEHTYRPPPTYPLEAAGEAERTKFVSFSYATQAAIVDVEEASGEVHVRRIVAAHDIGRTINPLGARGQIEGSCLMGLGYALSEEFILDRGYLATDTLAKVGIPVIDSSPPVDVLLIEDPDPGGPFGAKGIAEAAAIPTAPAILNAISRAVGVRIRRLPATPDRVTAECSATVGGAQEGVCP